MSYSTSAMLARFVTMSVLIAMACSEYTITESTYRMGGVPLFRVRLPTSNTIQFDILGVPPQKTNIYSYFNAICKDACHFEDEFIGALGDRVYLRDNDIYIESEIHYANSTVVGPLMSENSRYECFVCVRDKFLR